MKRDRTIYALMVPAAFLWSGAFIARKYTGPYIPSCSVTMMRFALATVMLHEKLQPIKIFTTVMIIIGVCTCQLAGKKTRNEEYRNAQRKKELFRALC